jgi:hypothetical protein
MRKMLTLLTAAMLIGTTGIASAESRSLPSSTFGLWCHAGGTGKATRYMRGRCKKHETHDYFEAGVGTMSGHEWGCDIRKVVVVGRTYKVSSVSRHARIMPRPLQIRAPT